MYERYVKRALDVLLSAVGLVVLSPLLALIALVIRLDDLMAWRDRFGASQIRPGLSGWAQVNGRDYLSRDLEKKARRDAE